MASMTGKPRRSTRQREAVLDVLDRSEEFRSAQQLHADLRSAGTDVGLTTVYRALQSLSEAGEVDVIRTDDGEQLFRQCEAGHHHHHLVCRQCGRTIEIEGPPVERWADKVAAEHGFRDVSHTLELFGFCDRCG